MTRLSIAALMTFVLLVGPVAAQTCSFICINGQPTQPAGPPQGRLTLVSDSPVMTASQSAATTIYYTPYNGNLVPIYNGTAFLATPFSELSNITTNSSTGSAGPAAVANNSNYDLFVWHNGGTVTLTRGPAWTSDMARGSGAGTTELQRVNGVLTNAVAIANGPGANLGTYVGTVRSDGSSQINFIFGGIGAGGTAAVLGVWNAYNRVDVRGLIGDSTNSWTYSTTAWRPSNNSTTMRVSFVSGLPEDFIHFDCGGLVTTNAGGGNNVVGVGYDSTTAASGRLQWGTGSTTSFGQPNASYSVQPLGFHFGQMLEFANGSGITTTWFGDFGQPNTMQTGMNYVWRY